MRLSPSRPLGLVLATAFVAAALPASASALTLHIANESGRPANQVFVDVASGAVPPVIAVSGFPGNDESKPLSEIPGGNLEIEKLISGRIYVSYGAPVHEGVTPESAVRYDWAELTVTPNPADAANLTAVNQVGIGMQLSTFGPAGEPIESLGSTYANTLFAALQQIPGGPQSTVRAPSGEILRVLSPDNVNSAYPPLTEYVHSMAGQTITLHTPFFKAGEDTWSVYSGTFEADGSITLTGKKRVETGPEENAADITIGGQELIDDIYTGANTPNNLEGAVRRDVLAGFSLGLWGGRYGNDAIDFCTDKIVETQGERCPTFNVPAFAEARTTPPPFAGPAYEQYASVINQYTSIYGNPYSDDSKKVQIALDQPQVKTLQLTILPDSPPTPTGGSSGSGPGSGPGSGTPGATTAPPAPTLPLSMAKLEAPRKAKLKKGRIAIGKVACQGACGRVVATLHPAHGKAFLLGIEVSKNVRTPSSPIVLKPTKACLRLLKRGAQGTKLTVLVTQDGHRMAIKTAQVRLTR